MTYSFANPDGSGVIHSMVNPVTHSMVRFTEPFDYKTGDQREAFVRAFGAYCDRMWAGEARGDPLVVNPYSVWAGDESYTEEPLRALQGKLDELVAEFGIWMVAKTAMGYVDHTTIQLYLEGHG